MKKILPFQETPWINTYPNIAFYVGVLEATNRDITKVLMNEFLDIFFFRGKLDFTATGFFHKKYFRQKRICFLKMLNVQEMITQIDQNRYIVAVLNHHEIQNPMIRSAANYYHDWLIYGYDTEKEVFYCSGYLDGRNGGIKLPKYGSTVIRFQDFTQSTRNTKLNRFSFSKNGNHLFWIGNPKACENSQKSVAEKLKKFATPSVVGFAHRPVIHMNLKGIEKFCKFVQAKAERWNQDEPCSLHLQSFRVLYEHHKVLELLMKEYEPERNVTTDLFSVNSYSILLLATKYDLRPNQKTLCDISNRLTALYDSEKKAVASLIKRSS